MSDETVPILPSTSDVQSPTDNGNLQDMFSQFLKTSEENQLRHQAELSAIKAVVDRLSENSSLESTSDHVDTPPDRRQTNRRTSIFFSSAPSQSCWLERVYRFRYDKLFSPDSNRRLLSVSTPWGLFRPKFLPEGVGPASGILQAIVRTVFADFEEWTIVIFDNFLVLATDFADMEVLQLVWRRSGGVST
jgi:hypothetical protein